MKPADGGYFGKGPPRVDHVEDVLLTGRGRFEDTNEPAADDVYTGAFVLLAKNQLPLPELTQLGNRCQTLESPVFDLREKMAIVKNIGDISWQGNAP